MHTFEIVAVCLHMYVRMLLVYTDRKDIPICTKLVTPIA
jgi:hypothetical protein